LRVVPNEQIYLDVRGREVLRERHAFTSGDGWIREETQYDTAGRVAKRSLPYFSGGGSPSYVNTFHDVRGRVVRDVRPDSGITTTVYAGSGGTTTVTATETVTVPGASNVTRVKQTVFDARGLVTSTTDAHGETGAITTAYAYDAQGNLTVQPLEAAE
jgi:YD repeat-containing protein